MVAIERNNSVNMRGKVELPILFLVYTPLEEKLFTEWNLQRSAGLKSVCLCRYGLKLDGIKL